MSTNAPRPSAVMAEMRRVPCVFCGSTNPGRCWVGGDSSRETSWHDVRVIAALIETGDLPR